MKQSLVVVGSGSSPYHLVSALVGRGATDQLSVTVVSPEPVGPYERALFPSVVAGRRRAAELVSRPAEWYAEHGVSLRLGLRMTELDRARREVRLSDGTVLHYDRLVLDVGSKPLSVPSWVGPGSAGACRPPVFTLSDLAGLASLSARAATARSAVVVGGGPSGVEIAWALAARGLAVDLVEAASRLMPSLLDAEAAQVMAARLSEAGIVVHPDSVATGASRVGDGDGDGDEVGGVAIVRRTASPDGVDAPARERQEWVAGDMVVLACGTVADAAAAAAAGLEVTSAGIVVDGSLRTSDPCIYAVGDCTDRSRQAGCSPEVDLQQAEALAAVLTGKQAPYSEPGLDVQLATPGLDVVVMGEQGAFVAPPAPAATATPAATPAATAYMRNPLRGIYRAVTVEDGVLRRAVLVGDATAAPQLRAVRRSVMPLACQPVDLIGAAIGPNGVAAPECDRSSAADTVTKQTANTAALRLVPSLEEAST